MTTRYSPTTLAALLRFLTIKQSVWCFLFVTLFNLQGTRRFRRNIAIIQHFIPFVKNFFQKFSAFGPCRFRSNFLSLPHSLSFVKCFFKSFSNPRTTLRSYPVSNSVRVPQLAPFVKLFLSAQRLPFESALLLAPPFQTACLEYQRRRQKSTVFPLLCAPFPCPILFLPFTPHYSRYMLIGLIFIISTAYYFTVFLRVLSSF